MKSKILCAVLIGAMSFTACQMEQHKPEVDDTQVKNQATKDEMRAMTGEKVQIILNHIKNESKADFETFIDNTLYPLIREAKEDITREQYKKTRYLKATTQNADSTWTYTFLMDPYIEGADYSFVSLFKKKYSDEEIEGFMNQLGTCFARPQESYVLMQTKD